MPLSPGQRLGAYEIRSVLGAGGMGEVYRARDTTLRRDVAVKLLPALAGDDPQRRTRLLQEARAAASLNHPNICTIYEVGEAEGHAYIAMEVVEGEPLNKRLAERPLPASELVRFGVQLADAVAHAHGRGIVHRDLKSSNVMITPEGRVKVLDFGLAKSLGGQELTDLSTHADLSLTEPGAVVGTLAYMAPEQLRGVPADARSDVWALGVVLHEMAAGARPFSGRTGYELSSAILHEPPPPLPARVPAPVQAVIRRCLEKEPTRRYQRADEVRAALEMMEHPSSDVVPRRVQSRRPTRLVAGFAIGVTLIVAAAAVWFNAAASRDRLAGRSPQIRSIAVLPLENLSSDPEQDYFSAGMHEALITDLAQIGLQKVIAKSSADAFKKTTKSLREIGQELGVEGLVTGSVMRGNNRIQVTAQLVRADTGAVLWANRYERNVGDVLALQNELVGAIAREVRATITPLQTARLAAARPVNPAAYDAYLKGRALFASLTATAPTRTGLDALIAQYERAIQVDPTYAPPYAALSEAYETAAQTSLVAPADTFPRAKAAALKAMQLDDQLPAAHAALASVFLWHDWNWAGAKREIDRALQLSPDAVEGLIASLNYLVLVAGDAVAADRISQRILTVDPLNPFSRIQTVWTAFFSRRHDDAIRNARTLQEIWPGNLMAPFMLASNYAVERQRAEVGVECGKILRALSGAYNMQLLGMCAWAFGVVGETGEARRLLRIVEQPPADAWLDPAVMSNAYGAIGDIDRAIEWCRKGLDQRAPNIVYMKVGPPWDPIRSDPRFQAMLREMNFPE
jgi:serine/threonine-protein kinase